MHLHLLTAKTPPRMAAQGPGPRPMLPRPWPLPLPLLLWRVDLLGMLARARSMLE
jgi:hypothetical protein